MARTYPGHYRNVADGLKLRRHDPPKAELEAADAILQPETLRSLLGRRIILNQGATGGGHEPSGPLPLAGCPLFHFQGTFNRIRERRIRDKAKE
jgi:hypothetical protein